MSSHQAGGPVPESDHWQQYLRQWRRLSPEKRRAAILELSEEDREAFRVALAGLRAAPPAANPGAPAAGPSRLPLLLGLLACVVVAALLVRGLPGRPGRTAPTASGPAAAGVAEGAGQPAPPTAGAAGAGAGAGKIELIDLVRAMALSASWTAAQALHSPIAWRGGQPELEGGVYHRDGEVAVSIDGRLLDDGKVPWSVVLSGPDLQRVNRVTIETQQRSPDLLGFRLSRYLQRRGWSPLWVVRCQGDLNPVTRLQNDLFVPFWIEEIPACDLFGCREVIRIYLDGDEAENVTCLPKQRFG